MKFTTTTTFLLLTAYPLTILAQIPDFLITDFAGNQGTQELEVIYGPNKLQDGETLSLADVQDLPTFKVCDSCGVAPAKNFIIMLLDVDGSGDPENAQTLHYLKTDFGSDQGGTGLISEEGALIPYLPPSLEGADGPHRYVWLMFHQKRIVAADEIQGIPDESERDSFSITEWLAANEGIDSPDWGVHFVASSDSDTEFTTPVATPTRSRGTPTRIVDDEPVETGDNTEDDIEDDTEDGGADDGDDLVDAPDNDDSIETPDDDSTETPDNDIEDDSDAIPSGTPIVTGGNPQTSTTGSVSAPSGSGAPAESDGAATSLKSVYGGFVAGAVIAVSMFFAW